MHRIVAVVSALAATRAICESGKHIVVTSRYSDEDYVWWIASPYERDDRLRKGRFVDTNLYRSTKTLEEFIKNGRE